MALSQGESTPEVRVEATKPPQTWSTRMVFLLAAVGASVGLGNVWKFPYTAGVSGGGAFVLVYLAATVAVAVPIVVAELLIGRRGRASPVTSFRRLAEQSGASPRWRLVGWLNIAAVFLILSYYSVIAGWALSYVPRLASGRLAGASSTRVAAEFDALLADPVEMAAAHALFLALTVAIVSLGLRRGIELAIKLLMPALFAMLLLLVAWASIAGDFAAAFRFLFAFDFGRVDAGVVLTAIGQSFFSVGVAMGLMMVYGSYMRPEEPIVGSAFLIAGADTLVALLAGLAVFPLVFANGLDPAEGPGLIFVTLPIAFAQMPAGTLFGTLFFVLLVVAALTSSIAILETTISWALEREGARRPQLAVAAGLGAWLLGLATVLSFNHWKELYLLSTSGYFTRSTFFDLVDFLASNVMLTLGGILIACFAGWILRRHDCSEELGLSEGWLLSSWRFLVRWVAPVSIGAVLIASLR